MAQNGDGKVCDSAKDQQIEPYRRRTKQYSQRFRKIVGKDSVISVLEKQKAGLTCAAVPEGYISSAHFLEVELKNSEKQLKIFRALVEVFFIF